MGLFSKKEKETPISPLEKILDKPLYILEGVGVKLFVHDKCLIFDRTKGAMNLGNKNYKVLPFKYITSVQVKTMSSLSSAIEFSTYAYERANLSDGLLARAKDENAITLNINDKDDVKMHQEAIEYIVSKIL